MQVKKYIYAPDFILGGGGAPSLLKKGTILSVNNQCPPDFYNGEGLNFLPD